MSERKPNILFFVADQMRNDALHHMGNEAAITPNLDKILEEGVSFKNAYCQNPVCVPSRNSFLSGLYPHTTGHRTMHYLQREDEPNLLRTMKQNGYHVVWIGRNDIIPANRSKSDYCDEYYNGFSFDDMKDDTTVMSHHGSIEVTQEMIDSGKLYSFYLGKLKDSSGYGVSDWNSVKSALDFIDRAESDKPFFVYCTISFPHPPYGCEEPWFSSIDRNKLQPRRTNIQQLKDKPSMLYGINEKQNMNQWSEAQYDEIRATYLAMVSRFDHQYGLIRDKLKEKGLYEQTNIFVYSDHGDYTGDYGIVEKVQNCFENPISNVPLLIKPSDGLPIKPGISESLVELLDLSATLADIANFELPYTQFGKSLLGAVSGIKDHKDCVICEGGRIHGEKHAMELGHGPTSPYYPRLATQSSEGPEHTKACMIRMNHYKYTMRLYEKDEFYDLLEDPYELTNQIDNDKYRGQIDKMRARLLRHYMETSDTVPIRKDPR